MSNIFIPVTRERSLCKWTSVLYFAAIMRSSWWTSCVVQYLSPQVKTKDLWVWHPTSDLWVLIPSKPRECIGPDRIASRLTPPPYPPRMREKKPDKTSSAFSSFFGLFDDHLTSLQTEFDAKIRYGKVWKGFYTSVLFSFTVSNNSPDFRGTLSVYLGTNWGCRKLSYALSILRFIRRPIGKNKNKREKISSISRTGLL